MEITFWNLYFCKSATIWRYKMHNETEGISEAVLEEIIEMFSPCMDDYLYLLDFKRDFYRISSEALKRFALPGESFYDAMQMHKQFVYPEDYPLLIKDHNDIISGKKKFHNLHYRWLDKSGNPIWINCRGRVINDGNGEPYLLIGCINEIGNKQKADNVSGLLGETSLSSYVHKYTDKKISGFFMRIGIDDFSLINGNFGVKYGDFILKHTANCIMEHLNEHQKLFHVGADDFMIVDFAGGTVEDASELYKKIRLSINRFIENNKYKMVYTISTGIMDVSSLTDGYDSVMKLSEFALNEARNRGKNSYYIFDYKEYDVFLRKRMITRKLHHAVNHNFQGFEAYFQPIVDTKTYRLLGAEALMRFTIPADDGSKEAEMISPAEFVPLLEETGLIIPAGKWILNKAISLCSIWQKYIPQFRVNVNLSYIQVSKSSILDEILMALNEHKLDSSCIGIELTESGYIDSNPHYKKLWEGLKKNGVKIILDDFGTGYSNLHCLGELNPTYIKIDRTFTLKALNNEYERKLMKYIIDMAHSLGLAICVEGIETPNELISLQSLSPDYIQGYLFGRPYPGNEFYKRFINVE